ncbi:MAG: aminoglycoside phosphotransferase family protein [Pyrinomonadaceae bacterium]
MHNRRQYGGHALHAGANGADTHLIVNTREAPGPIGPGASRVPHVTGNHHQHSTARAVGPPAANLRDVMSAANASMLSIENSLPYLLERGLVTPRSVLEGDLLIANAARRNRNLRVTRKDGVSYLVKQPDDPTFGGSYTLRREAAFYQFCRDDPAAAAIGPLLPRLLYFDPERVLLALELFEEAKQPWRLYTEAAAEKFPAYVSGALGRALGLLHQTFRALDPAAPACAEWLRSDIPWVMQVHKPGPEVLSNISPANYQTLRILQTQEDLSQHLDSLRRLWQPQTIIHSDIKSDNVLVMPAPADAKTAEVRLVDWETVQYGDSAWDVAGALQDFVLFWVSSMTQGLVSLEEMVATARYSLIILQTAVRSLWRGYRASAQLKPDDADALLGRAVRFSAARLIQSAYEMAMNAQVLPVISVLLLQVSSNLLADPETGQLQLYGIFQEVPAP